MSNTGYFVYCNGRRDLDKFDAKLEFDLTLIPYEGNDGWVEGTIHKIHKCLNSYTTPEPDEDCDYCLYRDEVKGAPVFNRIVTLRDTWAKIAKLR